MVDKGMNPLRLAALTPLFNSPFCYAKRGGCLLRPLAPLFSTFDGD